MFPSLRPGTGSHLGTRRWNLRIQPNLFSCLRTYNKFKIKCSNCPPCRSFLLAFSSVLSLEGLVPFREKTLPLTPGFPGSLPFRATHAATPRHLESHRLPSPTTCSRTHSGSLSPRLLPTQPRPPKGPFTGTASIPPPASYSCPYLWLTNLSLYSFITFLFLSFFLSEPNKPQVKGTFPHTLEKRTYIPLWIYISVKRVSDS